MHVSPEMHQNLYFCDVLFVSNFRPIPQSSPVMSGQQSLPSCAVSRTPDNWYQSPQQEPSVSGRSQPATPYMGCYTYRRITLSVEYSETGSVCNSGLQDLKEERKGLDLRIKGWAQVRGKKDKWERVRGRKNVYKKTHRKSRNTLRNCWENEKRVRKVKGRRWKNERVKIVSRKKKCQNEKFDSNATLKKKKERQTRELKWWEKRRGRRGGEKWKERGKKKREKKFNKRKKKREKI